MCTYNMPGTLLNAYVYNFSPILPGRYYRFLLIDEETEVWRIWGYLPKDTQFISARVKMIKFGLKMKWIER